MFRYIRVHIGIRIVFNYFYLSKEKSQDDKFSTVVLKKSCELKESLACIVYKQDETSLTACSLGNCLRLRDLFFFSSFGFVQPKANVEWWIIYQKSIRILLKIGPFFKWFGRACLLVWVSISPWCLLPFSLSLNLANLHHSAPPGLNGPETDHQTKPTIQNSIFNKGSVTILQSFIIKQAAEIPNSK